MCTGTLADVKDKRDDALTSFLLINLTSSKSITSNESSQVPTSTDANDLGPTTEVYNTAANVDVTTNSVVVTETGSQNIVGDAAATTPSIVETQTSDVYFSDEGILADSLSLIPTTQETSLLQDVNALQHHPSAQIDTPIPHLETYTQPEPPLAKDDHIYQLSSDVQYHPSDVASSTNTPQEPVIDLLNSGTFATEPLVQHFPSDALPPTVPQSKPNFTDALTIPDDAYKHNLSSPVMYDDVYDDYGGANGQNGFEAYDDHPSDDYTAMDQVPEPEEANYGLEELSESDLEQLDDNDLQELEEVLATADDKYDDFEESNVAGNPTNSGYSGEVLDDFGETTASKHIPFKIPKHQNYLKTLENLKHFSNGFHGYTQQPSFDGEEAEDDADDHMNIFNTQAPGQPGKHLYNDRLVALLDIYKKNANRRHLQAKQRRGKHLKYDTKALMQTYDALMHIKHRKMGRKGKYVKSYKSKGNRSKQIRRLQRIKRLMALAAKRKASKTKTGGKSGPQIALSTIAKAAQSAANDAPMLSLSSLQNGIKTTFQHPNEPTNPINGVMNQINQAMYYHPDDHLASPQYHPGDVASGSSESTNIPPNPFQARENQRQQRPRFMEYDEIEYEAPEMETESEVEGDEAEDDFLNNLFGVATGKRGSGSGYQNNAALYGKILASMLHITTKSSYRLWFLGNSTDTHIYTHGSSKLRTNPTIGHWHPIHNQIRAVKDPVCEYPALYIVVNMSVNMIM
ncbi:hypothetical protein LOTGIDRAFT_236688 [Lottia gigantea]|uniref:Uncharacterized protein n=1 Tax=Lottia gigantea TaxID=225164 RepID=V4B4M2_LOTGI|nr:hypothetical protein LOTGIDRAFT_236688 [Lottia gigantea]ESO83369.1 hypothetical protein LOTGIDRAFT_236688 [Lottia gigantea]